MNEANKAAIAMVDRMPLRALQELHEDMLTIAAKYKRMGIDSPPASSALEAKVKGRIAKLQAAGDTFAALSAGLGGCEL